MKPETRVPRQLRLGDRLRSINALSLGLALTLVTLILTVSSFVLNLHSLTGASIVKARVLAENAAASLLFSDEQVAQELLRSLKHSPDVQAAAIYDQFGKAFARYENDSRPLPASLTPGGQGVAMDGIDSFSVSDPIQHDGQALGTIVLRIDLAELYVQMAWQILITLLAAALAAVVARQMLKPLDSSVL